MHSRAAVAMVCASMLLAVVGCGSDDDGADEGAASGGSGGQLTEVTAQFTFEARGEYAFLFIADKEGFFEDEGLDVSFREGEGAQTVLASLASSGGKNTIVVASGNQAAASISAGLPVVTVATWEPTSPSVLVSKPDVPLASPKDLEGKVVGVKEGLAVDLVLPFFLRDNDVDADAVDERTVDSSVANQTFLTGDLDVVDAFLTNEVPILQEQVREGDLNVLELSKFGFPDVGLVANVTKEYAKADPDTISAFLRAAARGIEAMKEDPAAAAEAIKDSDLGSGLPDTEIVEEQVKNTVTLMPDPGDKPYGYNDPERWKAMVETQKRTGVIDKALPVDDYIDNTFVEASK